MLEGPTADRSLTPEEAQHFERACDAFEAAWQAGRRPTIEQYLAEAPVAVRRELLRELVELDVAYRTRHGEQPTLGEYLDRFPDYRGAALRSETLALGPVSVSAAADAPGPSPSAAAGWPQFPGYEIVEELGRGGMGVVYKAKQLAAKRFVALKMIRDGVLAGPGHRARFRIEAEAAARCQHPNLVRIYEVGEHAGLPYFSMELAAGGGLDRKLAGRPLPPREAAELLRTLAEAVEYAHEKQIVHRDLKPANVVLTAEGRPLITDFGLAKRLDSDTAVTGSAAVLGTASYMAPEQAEGRAREVGPATDVYALGAILYELLTGRPPFQGESWQATVAQVVQDDPVPPAQVRPEVPADLETVCLKCLEKQPSQRYASARDLAEDLRRFLAGETVAAAPVSEWERQARWISQAGFEVEEVLTYGVHDAVYRARQVHLNRPVALKVLVPPAQPDPAAPARMRQYAQIAGMLAHPNIVSLYMSGELRGRTYLAFEYVPGGSLIERYVDRPAPPDDAALLVRRLAEAVQYAHEREILHGALRPSIVLLSAEGVPKITNFGLSVLVDPAASEQRGVYRRLPSYMAPEVAEGRTADVGPASDVYALGAILYKLLTGGPPFLAETFAQTLEQVRTQTPPAPSTVQVGVPAALDAICLRCLKKQPARRYARAGDLVEELAGFLAGDPPVPSPDSPVRQPQGHERLRLEKLRRVEESRADLPRFPGYELLRVLGRGSLSVIYEARRSGSDRHVALKTLQQEFRYGEPLRALLREVTESVSRLQHPNIVQVYECGELSGRPYFVMELLPGGSLDHRPAGRMPGTEAACLVRTLARTMETVHSQGIIHGNLKPSKVLLATDGAPKLTGFIIARHQREVSRQEQAHMTASGHAVMGTPRYMAPEQLSGTTRAIGPVTDVHALGLILYELLTGWLPYRAPTLWELLGQVLQEAPQPPRELCAEVPPDLDAVCLRCLAKKPEERYPSAGALADDLDHFLAGEPLLSPSPSHPGVWSRLAGWLTNRPRK